MKIVLNNEEIDFTLEDEKTLGDVLSGIEKWIQKSGFNITSIRANGKTLLLEEEKDWREKKFLLEKCLNLFHLF